MWRGASESIAFLDSRSPPDNPGGEAKDNLSALRPFKKLDLMLGRTRCKPYWEVHPGSGLEDIGTLLLSKVMTRVRAIWLSHDFW